MAQSTSYGLSTTVNLSWEATVERTREELGKEGFGVLTEIDVRETLKKKLDIDFKKYIILGACNPPLAHQALSAEEEIGLLLPCNVIVYESDTRGATVVAALDPVEQLKITGNEEIGPLADEVRSRMIRVLEGVAS